MSINRRYTREQLLALAPKHYENALTAVAMQQFNVIETESVASEASPSEPHRTEAPARKGEGKNGGGNRRPANTERFAPPSRVARGNRDQEAFEEGYKYELERNAIKKQTLQETMAKEKEKIDAAAKEKTKEETKQHVTAPAPPAEEERKGTEDEEVERWIASIGIDDGAKKVTKSRFFSGTDSGSKSAAASPLAGGRAFDESPSLSVATSVKDQWGVHEMIPTSGNVVWNNVDTQHSSGIEPTPGTATNSMAMPNVFVGSGQLSMHSGMSVPSSMKVVSNDAPPSSSSQPPSTSAMQAPLNTVLSNTSQKPMTSATTTTTTPLSGVPLQINLSANSQTQRWNVRDLEQLLTDQNMGKQPKQEAPKSRVIDAAALESQLLLQVQQSMARSQQQAQTQAQTQAQAQAQAQAQTRQQQQPPQPHPTQILPMSGNTATVPLSGRHTPPQVHLTQPPQQLPQLQPQQPGVTMPWGVTVPKVPSQQIHQKLMQPQPQLHHHPSMGQPVPFIMSGTQGSPYFHQQAIHGHYMTGFMPGQGQQPMVVYRSPDAMTQYAVGTTGYPPNAQILLPQPQHQQQQPQRR